MLQPQQHAVGPTSEVVRCPAHIPPSVACVCVAAPSEDSEVGGEGEGGGGGGVPRNGILPPPLTWSVAVRQVLQLSRQYPLSRQHPPIG